MRYANKIHNKYDSITHKINNQWSMIINHAEKSLNFYHIVPKFNLTFLYTMITCGVILL